MSCTEVDTLLWALGFDLESKLITEDMMTALLRHAEEWRKRDYGDSHIGSLRRQILGVLTDGDFREEFEHEHEVMAELVGMGDKKFGSFDHCRLVFLLIDVFKELIHEDIDSSLLK
jgi:hypothetical protein